MTKNGGCSTDTLDPVKGETLLRVAGQRMAGQTDADDVLDLTSQ